MTRRATIVATALGALLSALSASAQTTSEVRFAPGDYGTMLTGTVTGDEYVDYRLGADAGQEMFVELTPAETNGNGTIYFNILPPGSSGEAIYNGSIDGNTTIVPLPQRGDYTIRVYLMGNDRDTGRTVDYRVDVSIQEAR